MIKLSVTFFYDLGISLRPLASIADNIPAQAAMSTLYSAQYALEGLFSSEWFFPAIKSSRPPGESLLKAIKDVTSFSPPLTTLGAFHLFPIKNALNEFETALRAELKVADAYFVSQKGGFDSSTLIENGERLFPQALAIKVPGAIPDVRQGSRCLAFDLATAAGFHILRAVESVLREYWIAVSKGKSPPKERNLGVYLETMKKEGVGDDKVISALRDIKSLHRNPLMHPEDILTTDDAVGLIGIARGAINAMLKEIPVPDPIESLMAGIPADPPPA